MASRPALVLGADGLPQQLQSSDDLAAGAWAVYAPATSTTAGTVGTTVSGRYRKMGTTVSVQIQIQITSVGLGAAGLSVSLPVAASAFRWTIPGEVIGGNMVRGAVAASASTMTITTYNAGSPLAVGIIVLSGTYESAT